MVMDTALQTVFDATLARLARAAVDGKSPWRLPILATVSADLGPQARIVVLRAFDRAQMRFTAYTDARTPKRAEIAGDPRTSLLFWDKGVSLQLRASAHARIETEGPAVDAAKATLGDYQSSDYARWAVPGSPAEAAETGLHEDPLAHFALLTLTADRLDWRELARTGHRRALFSRSDAGWDGVWTVP